ncbi:MAG: alkaline phosphatase family protein [Candidatus Omnitrophota bacterium]
MIKMSSASREPRTEKRAQNKKNVKINILIDALGWEYVKNRPFLEDIASTKIPVKSLLGFSSGVIPSILTGKYPREHEHWALYFYAPETSPFRWSRILSWVPGNILNSRVSRKIIEEISRRVMGYTGYFETYLIPVEQLKYFDISESRNIYKPEGIRSADSIFDIFHKNNVNYKCYAYPAKDKEIFLKAKKSIENNESDVYFLYLSELDHFLHSNCDNNRKVNERISLYEDRIMDLYNSALGAHGSVQLMVFSDHGMAKVDEAYDLRKEIDASGLKALSDYKAFYDSTMARFWFSNENARENMTTLLKKKPYGRILSREDLLRHGVYFDDDRYGETIFLMNTGTVITPSFMGNKAPCGMHGYDPDDKKMDAMLVSTEAVQDVGDVRGLFGLIVGGKG